MKAKFLIGGLLVFGLALVGGTQAAFAQGPVDDPDAYTVSIVPEVAQAPALPEIVALADDPDAYTVPVDDATFAQFNYSLFAHADGQDVAASVAAASVIDSDPDAYTVPATIATLPEPSAVNPDPDAYSTTFTEDQLQLLESQLFDSYTD